MNFFNLKYTKKLNDTNHKEIELVGGKNASLGEMLSNLSKKNINIPNGFLINAIGYQRFIDHNKLNNNILNLKNSSNIKQSCNELKNLIVNGSFPNDLKTEIEKMYLEVSKQYKVENVDVAVRSSSTAEDMPDASKCFKY